MQVPEELAILNQQNRLARKYGFSPFSILDASNPDWQVRKKAWIRLGIKSELGRGEVMTPDGRIVNAAPGGAPMPIDRTKNARVLSGRVFSQDIAHGEHDGIKRETETLSGTSIFDPFLCELMYRWFAGKRSMIFDPFAGGSVRGVVAGLMGHRYRGIELRREQVEANRMQWATMAPKHVVQPDRVAWYVKDTVRAMQQAKQWRWADFILSCPPYAFLERYSDDTRDLSTMSYKRFLARYRYIVKRSMRMLKPDRFACFVVGDVRNSKKHGMYINFVGDTITAFQDAGLGLYNHIIFATPLGSLPFRVDKQMMNSRKIGMRHQHVLVFIKGDPVKARKEMTLNTNKLLFIEIPSNAGLKVDSSDEDLREGRFGMQKS